MNAKLNALIIENEMVGNCGNHIFLSTNNEIANNFTVVNDNFKAAMVMIKNIGLFFASPFIALAYIIVLPPIGFFVISKLAIKAYKNRKTIDS